MSSIKQWILNDKKEELKNSPLYHERANKPIISDDAKQVLRASLRFKLQTFTGM